MIQWKYYPDKDGKRAIKVRLAWKGQTKYVPVSYQGQKLMLSEEDWNKIQTDPSVAGSLRKIRDEIRATEVSARDAVNSTTGNGKRPFSWERFSSEFSTKKSNSFLQLFDRYLEELKNQDRIGTYRTYKSARVALAKFLGRDIDVHELTASQLQRLEKWLLEVQHVNKTTVAIYMRSIKVIWNMAAQQDKSLSELYPFARRKNERGTYSIKTGAGHRGDTLTLDQLKRLVDAATGEGTSQWRAKSLWLFSLYSHGMNFRDIAMLKVGSINTGYITYVRHKTRNTEGQEGALVIPISVEIQKILTGLATGRNPDDYLFDILRNGMNPSEIDKKIADEIKKTNAALGRICKRIGLPKVTTYWARHTYASMLKWNDVPIEFISEMLGHANVKTTAAYLRRFDPVRIAAVDAKLLSSIKEYVPPEATDNDEQTVAKEPEASEDFLRVA